MNEYLSAVLLTSVVSQSYSFSVDRPELTVRVLQTHPRQNADNVIKNHLQTERERNDLFNDALNTFYLRLYGVRHVVKDHSDSEKGNPLPPTGATHRLTARILLYAPSHRQDNTYHGLCYTSCGALAGTRNSSMGPPHEGSIRRPIAP